MTSHTRRYDLVICDIDGCLTPESPTALDAELLTRVAEYNRRAVSDQDRPVVTLCTGRPQPFAEAICRLIGNLHVPCVAENGVWLYEPGTNGYWMDPAITEEHRTLVQSAETWMRRTFGAQGFTIQPGKSASISLYHPDRDQLLQQVPRVEEACAQNGWPLRISTTWFYINCDLIHISKATGIARLLEKTPIARERLAGIGDTYGDRFIADSVAFFACPSNADAQIRERAHSVSPFPEVAGVLDILETLR